MTTRTRKSRQVQAVALSSLSFGSGGDPDLMEAAGIIADTARGLASWSRKIPRSISVSAGGDSIAVIAASAPDARPAEYRLSHPLFGNREHWYGPPGQPFLSPAALSQIDAAMEKYAGKIDKMLARAGYR